MTQGWLDTLHFAEAMGAFFLLAFLIGLIREWRTQRRLDRFITWAKQADIDYLTEQERRKRQQHALDAIMRAGSGGHDHAA